jgi:hypothetical protein
MLSQAWRAPRLGAPGEFIAGGAGEHGRTIPLAVIAIPRRRCHTNEKEQTELDRTERIAPHMPVRGDGTFSRIDFRCDSGLFL